ncbi:MAG: hypothetical protein SGJ20_12790 [Planctomycetota bacterium]|nr:hypothetical protein [Planctomycetota bacterium]
MPAGQFGFLLTEESVTVPATTMAFISIRAKYKFRGLVNVSGFHVDPAYKGRLIFAIFNAGPGPVHLSRGEECFLIWYADLDQPSKLPMKIGFDSIPSELTGPIAGGLQSFAGLLSKISENDKKINDRVTAVEKEQAIVKWAAALVIGILLTLGVREFNRPNTAVQTNAPAAHTSPTAAPSTGASSAPASSSPVVPILAPSVPAQKLASPPSSLETKP